MQLSLYIGQNSIVHACPASVKMAIVFAAGIAVFATSDMFWLSSLLLLSIGLVALSRLPLAFVWSRCLPFLLVMVLFFAAHAVLTSVETGLVVVTRFAIMILLGLLLAMTSRLSHLVAVLEKVLTPLKLFGVNPQKAGLVLSMSIRFIPLIGETYGEIAAAQKARGLDNNILALLIPLLIKLLQRADDISDALIARGADD